MPALTISAVNTATDQLTITDHGLTTGQGAAGLWGQDGATLPSIASVGILATDDFWIIRDDADHIRLASSQANALAGTALDITAAGSGTLLLLIGLPYRRSTTYVPNSGPPGSPTPGSQLKSADMNALQDDQIALWKWMSRTSQSAFPGVPRFWTIPVLPGNPWIVKSGSPPAYDQATVPKCSVAVQASTDAYYPILIPESPFKIWRVDAWVDSVGGITPITLYNSFPIGGTLSSIAGATVNVPNSGVFAARSMIPTTPFSLGSGQVMWLRVNTPTSTVFAITALDVLATL